MVVAPRIVEARSRTLVLIPIVAMACIQLASGVPGPSYFSSETQLSTQSRVSTVLFAPGQPLLNLLHVPVFAGVALLWCWSLRPWAASSLRVAAVALGASTAFGVYNEVSQLAVPSRYATLGDALLNLIGVACGLLLYFHFARARPPAEPART